jgi:formamidopyrimidine-DNA glycosylase
MQNIISGLGNIYSDEVLFKSHIKPTRLIKTLTETELKSIFKYTPLILKKALELKGTTFATYRNPDGNPGSFVKFLNVYGRKNLPCKICKNKLESIKINNRSACYCKHCQK